jgi:hypothetical protein
MIKPATCKKLLALLLCAGLLLAGPAQAGLLGFTVKSLQSGQADQSDDC